MRLIDADEATKRVIENSTDEDRLKLVLAIADCHTVYARAIMHGKWISYGDFVEEKCSMCGSFSQGNTEYCPHCGAKMDQGDE